MGKSGSAPPVPDYNSLIPLQKQANLDVFNTMLGASRANQITPYGSSTWTSTPGQMTSPGTPGTPGTPAGWSSVPGGENGNMETWQQGTPGTPGSPASYAPDQWTNQISLSPQQQQLLDANTGGQLQQSQLLSGLAGRIGDATSSPIDFSKLQGGLTPSTFQAPTFAQNLGNGKDFSQQGADAVYGQMTRYLQPQQDTQQRQLESRLAEQGFVPGTQAYNTTMGEFQRNKDLAYADARDRATTQGYGLGNQWYANDLAGRGVQRQQNLDANSIADRLFNQNLTAHTQSLSDLLTQRQYPLNEYNAIRSGTQVTNPNVQPSFSTPNLQGTDLLGAANTQYQNALGGYNAGVGTDNALLGVLGTIGGSMMGAPWMGALLTGLAGGKK